MSRLDNILNNDGDDSTQVLPAVEAQAGKKADEADAVMRKISNTIESARQANDLDLLDEIIARLNGNADKKKTRTATTTGDKTFDKVNIVYLIAGGVLGFIVGMIIVELLQTELDGSRFDSVSVWVSALVVLMVTGFGVFLGSVAHDKWRK